MARGRFHSKTMLDNYRLNSLSLEAEFLFWRLILLADAEGRVKGEAKWVNKMVWPLRDYSDRKVELWLNKLHEAKDSDTGLGLIERYDIGGHSYIWLPGFEKHQKGLRKDREAKSEIPPPPADIFDKAGLEPAEPKTSAETKKQKTEDLKLAVMIDYYEQNAKRTLTPPEYDILVDIANTYPDGWFEKAVDEAVKNKAKSPVKYLARILVNWKEEGFNPLDGKRHDSAKGASTKATEKRVRQIKENPLS